MVTAVEPVLSVRGLETRFRRKHVHRGLDLDVLPGQILALLGGSGSGKSTLLRTFIGLERPSAGTCRFDGQDLFQLDEKAWAAVRRRIAYAFQNGALFDSLTVEENLLYPLEEHADDGAEDGRDKVRDILGRFGLGDIQGLLPGALSGGMQKRVGLARAIMLDPDVVLYDEPTAGLDPANTGKIADMMLALRAAGKTAVLVTHDTACALRVADRIALIYEGKVVANQTIEEVRSAPHPLIAAYLEGVDPHEKAVAQA